jgi:hypothetical protein
MQRKVFSYCLSTLSFLLLLSAKFHSSGASLFLYKGEDSKLIAAIHTADSIAALPEFWALIRSYPEQKIDNSDYSMQRLADTLEKFSGGPITVTYIGRFHTSNAKTGYTKRGRGVLRIGITANGYSQNRKDIAITLLHEWVHAVDYSLQAAGNKELEFAHFCDTQDRCVNKATASYRIERIVEVMLGGADFAKECRSSEFRPVINIPAKCK